MHFSTLTVKGQTTIPQEIREYLHLLPQDKIVYVPDGDKVYITYVRGSILNLKGIVKRRTKKPLDFHKLREQVKGKIAGEALKELTHSTAPTPRPSGREKGAAQGQP